MNSKFIVLILVIIVAILGVSAFLLSQNTSNDSNSTDLNQSKGTNVNNSTNGTVNNRTNNTNNTNNSNNSKVSVSASLSGPNSAKEGSSVTLTWKVTNNGNVAITNVQGQDQNENYNFGTIAPGESKSHSFSVNIPSSEQTKEDFGENSTVSSPFYIGGFALSYSANGKQFSMNSNSIEIALK